MVLFYVTVGQPSMFGPPQAVSCLEFPIPSLEHTLLVIVSSVNNLIARIMLEYFFFEFFHINLELTTFYYFFMMIITFLFSLNV